MIRHSRSQTLLRILYCSLKSAFFFLRVLDMAQSRRFGQHVSDFIKKVNASTVAPAFIVYIRKKLALDQREAAAIFGGGVNAFSRYETGKTRPPLALVKLLKVLDRHPELLDEVRAA